MIGLNGNVVQIVLPVHNEAGSIGAVLREFYQVVTRDTGLTIQFVVCEDGSTDDTVAKLEALKKELPIHLISGKERKGYSKAVVEGFAATSSNYVGFIDSDGQCDPRDFKALWEKRGIANLVMGWRNPRSDHWIRKLMSNAFKIVYSLFFKVPVRDPSCPYLIIDRLGLNAILGSGKVGILKQGFWWEFLARAVTMNVTITELPVAHRPRLSGTTQVYKPSKVPKIAYEHLLGLADLKRELTHAKGTAIRNCQES